MIDRRIGKIKVRRGTDLQRKQIVFEEGELIYTTDTKRTFIGDGITLGGIRVSNRNFITSVAGIPSNAQYGDMVYVSSTKKTYIIGTDDGQDILNPSLKLFLITDNNLAADLQQRIDDLYTKLSSLTGCLTKEIPIQPIPPTSTEFKWFIEPISQQVNIGDSVIFTAKAVGPYNDIMYTWENLTNNNFVTIPNKIGESFSIYNVQLSDISYYRCVATSTAGVLYSNPVSLLIS